MVHQLFSRFSGRFEPRQRDAWDDIAPNDAAARILRELNLSADQIPAGVDVARLDAACRTVASTQDGTIPRIHLVFPYPKGRRGAIPLAELARSLGSKYDLEPHCTLSEGMITVTFERKGVPE